MCVFLLTSVAFSGGRRPFVPLSLSLSLSLAFSSGITGRNAGERMRQLDSLYSASLRILPPVGRPLTAEIASGKDGPMTIELVAKNETVARLSRYVAAKLRRPKIPCVCFRLRRRPRLRISRP